MDEKRIAQTAGIALKIAKHFEKRATWGNGIYTPKKRWSAQAESKFTTEFKNKVQRAKEHREEAERTQHYHDHANHKHSAKVQHESHRRTQLHPRETSTLAGKVINKHTTKKTHDDETDVVSKKTKVKTSHHPHQAHESQEANHNPRSKRARLATSDAHR